MTIDLGELPRDDEPSPPPPPPSAGGWWHRYAWARQRPRHWLPAALVSLALTFAIAGAAPTPAPAGSPLFSVPLPVGAILQVDDEHLFVGGGDPEGGPDLRQWRAYRLADGAFAWEITVPTGEVIWHDRVGREMVTRTDFTIAHGLPMRVSHTRTLVGDEPWRSMSARVTALDPATGAPHWTFPGSPIGTTAGGLVLLLVAPAHGGHSKVAIDPATGDVAYRIHEEVAGGIWQDGRWLAKQLDGQLATYRLDTGARQASVRLAGAARVEQADDPPWLPLPQVVNSVVLAKEDGQLTARDAATLAVRWQLPVSGVDNVTDCGPVMCLQHAKNIDAYDWQTGRLRWSAPWPTEDLGRRMVQPWLTGWLRVFAHEGLTGRTHQQVRDAASGELMLDLGGWQPVSPPRSALLTRESGGQVWLGELTTDPPSVRVLAALGSGLANCDGSGVYLACESRDRIEVWRLRH